MEKWKSGKEAHPTAGSWKALKLKRENRKEKTDVQQLSTGLVLKPEVTSVYFLVTQPPPNSAPVWMLNVQFMDVYDQIKTV